MSSLLVETTASPLAREPFLTSEHNPAFTSEPVIRSLLTTKIRPQHRDRLAIVYVRQSPNINCYAASNAIVTIPTSTPS